MLADAFNPDTCAQALLNAHCPGRFEVLHYDTVTVYVDAAHNETGLHSTLETLHTVEDQKVTPVLIVGVSHDRPYQRMVPLLTETASHTVCTEARHKAAPSAALAAFVEGPTYCTSSVSEALSVALPLAKQEEAPLLITGGLFLAAEALWILQGKDPEQLRF